MKRLAFFQLPLQISGFMSFFHPRSKWQNALYQGTHLSLCCLLLACVPQPQPVPVASASAGLAPTVSPPVPTPTPSPLLEQRADGRFCAPVEPVASKPSLKYPIDLVVSSDGQDIYIVTKRCQDDVSQKPGLSSFTFPDCGAESDSRHAIPRSYIYHLHQGQGLEVLKINGQAPLSCELGEDIEVDSQGRLYVTTPYNHKIYRIDPQQHKLEQIAETRQEKLLDDKDAPPGHLLSGPVNLYVDKDQVYFALYEASPKWSLEQYIAEIDENQHQKIIFKNFEPLRSHALFMVTNTSFGESRQRIYSYHLGTLSVYGPPYPSPEKSAGFGLRTLVFNPLSPVGERADYPENSNEILGALKIDQKPDNYHQSMNIYASHLSWHRIVELPDSDSGRNVLYENRLYVFAGSGEPGFKNGHYRDAQFRFPAGLALDDSHDLYVADMGNHAIRKITRAGDVTTIYAEQPE